MLTYTYGSPKIQTFIPKAGDSVNDQPNGNGPNTKLKSLYNDLNYAWIMKYGMKMFLPQHMNSILVESWDTFKVSYREVIREIFVKNKLLPLISTGLTTNTQAFNTSVQVSSGSKDEETNEIPRHKVSPIEVKQTRTNDPMVALRVKGSQQSSKNLPPRFSL